MCCQFPGAHQIWSRCTTGSPVFSPSFRARVDFPAPPQPMIITRSIVTSFSCLPHGGRWPAPAGRRGCARDERTLPQSAPLTAPSERGPSFVAKSGAPIRMRRFQISLKYSFNFNRPGGTPQYAIGIFHIAQQYFTAERFHPPSGGYHCILILGINMPRPSRPSWKRACRSRGRCRPGSPVRRGCSGWTYRPLPSSSARTPARRTTWS